MDTALTNALISSATAASQTQTAQAVQVNVLRKAMDLQENAAATLLQALPQPQPLATTGPLGTQVNTYA